MAEVIAVEGLRKEYRRWRRGRTVAVDNLDISVPEGGVFGFLGPNGSGKTTTIRCLLGLIRPTSGHLRLFGKDISGSLPETIRDVGAIVETPLFFPNFSGRKNLSLLASVDGIGSKRVEEVLALVGLADRGDDFTKNYSLGMRQRLGIAAALLKDPRLLILDEPANGLDPAGIREIRGLLRSLGKEGRTVFVSSHLLSEIEQTCDAVVIVSKGRRITSGPVADVIASSNSSRGVFARVPDLDAGLSILQAAGFTVQRSGEGLEVAVPPGEAARISRALGQGGQWVTELRPQSASLEDTFLELTGDSGLDTGGQLR